jgi:hypothetical protein
MRPQLAPILECGEVDEPGAIGIVAECASRDFDREAGLANAPRADQSYDAIGSQAVAQLLAGLVAANQAGVAGRQVAGRHVGRGSSLAVVIWLCDIAGCPTVAIPNPPATDQTIASTRGSLQHRTVRTERLANGGNMDLQCVFADVDPLPDVRDQGFLGDQLASRFSQLFQYIERASPDRGRRSTDTKLLSIRVDLP